MLKQPAGGDAKAAEYPNSPAASKALQRTSVVRTQTRLQQQLVLREPGGTTCGKLGRVGKLRNIKEVGAMHRCRN